jgi:ribosomal-protein-alanine N-acetyltransferase
MIRRAAAADLPAIREIQKASPDAAQWDPGGYEVHVADLDGRVIGFLVSRAVAAEEVEILNLAVAPGYRRRGVARELLRALLKDVRGDVFLEVREANQAAQKFYQALGFQEVGRRNSYYENPPDHCIVMKFHSCYGGGGR